MTMYYSIKKNCTKNLPNASIFTQTMQNTYLFNAQKANNSKYRNYLQINYRLIT